MIIVLSSSAACRGLDERAKRDLLQLLHDCLMIANIDVTTYVRVIGLIARPQLQEIGGAGEGGVRDPQLLQDATASHTRHAA